MGVSSSLSPDLKRELVPTLGISLPSCGPGFSVTLHKQHLTVSRDGVWTWIPCD